MAGAGYRLGKALDLVEFIRAARHGEAGPRLPRLTGPAGGLGDHLIKQLS